MSLQLKITNAPEKYISNSSAHIPWSGITEHQCDVAVQTHTVLCLHCFLSEVEAVRSRPCPARLAAPGAQRHHTVPAAGALRAVQAGRGVTPATVLCCAVGAACPVPRVGCPTGWFLTPVLHCCASCRQFYFQGASRSPCLSPAAALIRGLLTCVLSAP